MLAQNVHIEHTLSNYRKVIGMQDIQLNNEYRHVIHKLVNEPVRENKFLAVTQCHIWW